MSSIESIATWFPHCNSIHWTCTICIRSSKCKTNLHLLLRCLLCDTVRLWKGRCVSIECLTLDNTKDTSNLARYSFSVCFPLCLLYYRTSCISDPVGIKMLDGFLQIRIFFLTIKYSLNAFSLNSIGC